MQNPRRNFITNYIFFTAIKNFIIMVHFKLLSMGSSQNHRHNGAILSCTALYNRTPQKGIRFFQEVKKNFLYENL